MKRIFVLLIVVLVSGILVYKFRANSDDVVDLLYEQYRGMEIFDEVQSLKLHSNNRPAIIIDSIDKSNVVVTNLVLPHASGVLKRENNSVLIDYSHSNLGYVMVRWKGLQSNKLKVLITGPNGIVYNYDLRSDGGYDTYPLTSGNGVYTVGVYKHIDGISYKTVMYMRLVVDLDSWLDPYLRPNKYINYGPKSKAIIKAVELCKGKVTDADKIKAIYDYIIDNIRYDSDKAFTVKSGYISNIDETLISGKGIAYDYASLMVAMLRSQGIGAKLVVGEVGDLTHVWVMACSKVDCRLNDEIKLVAWEWSLIDPTFIASNKDNVTILKYVGDVSHYKVKYTY